MGRLFGLVQASVGMLQALDALQQGIVALLHG
jgi:hypothetical protein